MVDPRGVVVSSARGFGEGIVCVVYELEFTCSFRTFGRIDGDTIGVCFECCSVGRVLVLV